MLNQFSLHSGFTVLSFLLSLALYIFICYFVNRADFLWLFLPWLTLFGLYFFWIQKVRAGLLNWKVAIGAALVFRLAVLFSLPNLSDDFYRFYWDGVLINAGYDPFLYLPVQIIEQGILPEVLTSDLLAKLNSPEYFTVYPPLCQSIFSLSTFFFPKSIYASVVTMKCFLFLFEAGTILIGIQLLKRLNLPQQNILWYALNPLVIVELCGNLHFEAAMIFFLVLAVYLLKTQRLLSAASFALSVCSKLLPLIFLPFIVKRLGLARSLAYFFTIFLISALYFALFIEASTINNMLDSVGLYFNKFEFNASIYYIIRWVGYQIKGWNVLYLVGPYLALSSFLLILFIALWDFKWKLNGNVFTPFLLALSGFFFLSTTVHPWYITTLVLFTVFTRHSYPILWSALIILTYSAYSSATYHESLWLVFIQYLPVFILLIVELCGKPLLQSVKTRP